MNIIIFGPPGAGKGTQSDFIVSKYQLFQLSTGDLLRREIKNKSEIGLKIQKTINAGNLVPDDIVGKLVENIVSNKEYESRIIFDGYPRNLSQAKNLDLLLKSENQYIGSIIFLNLSKEDIVNRISGRYICEKCGAILNEFTDNIKFNKHNCDKKYLKKRTDDNDKIIMKRFDDFTEQTKPVLKYYSSKPNFNEIDGSLKIDQITNKIEAFLKV